MRLLILPTICLSLVAAGLPAQAKGGFFPTYHPKPCEGDSCRADDPRSDMACSGLLCSISSAKAMQPPVTASQAAEMQAHAAAAAAAAAPPPAPMPVVPSTVKRRKVAAKRSKTPTPPATIDTKLADQTR